MNIVKGCIIDCALLYYSQIYVSLRVQVVREEYIINRDGSVYHEFLVKILKHNRPSYRYNNHYPVDRVVSARAVDLYDGVIVVFPKDYELLCAEKEARKKQTIKIIH